MAEKMDWEGFGRASAHEAIDVAASYSSLEEAIDAYYFNIGDTLTEHHATEKERSAAWRGWAAALTAAGAKYIP